MAAVRLSPTLKLGWWLHRWLYRLSGGRIGSRINGFSVLLLVTRGRRSGEPRRAALQSLEHHDGWAVIGSNAGEDRHPIWWLNLAAHPDAEVQIGTERIGVHAHETEGEERDALWRRFSAIDSAYDEYTRRTTRRIPVVVFERR